MKTVKLFGIIALAAVIGFAGCENGTSSEEEEPNPNPISDGTKSWVYDENAYSSVQIVFSSNGTYKLNGYSWTSEEYDEVSGEGSWTWNESAATVTLTATKILGYNAEYEQVLMTKSEAATAFQVGLEEEVEGDIQYYMDEDFDGEPDRTREDAEDYFLEMEYHYSGKIYATVAEYIAGEVAKKLEAFDPRPYTHFFAGETLVLLEALPAPVGTDELAGKTFTMLSYFGEDTYEFSGTGRTFTITSDERDTTITGSYSYNSTTKLVYFKEATIDGQTPAQFYAAAEPDEYSNYPTEADDKAAQTNQQFKLFKFTYDAEDLSLGVY